MATSVELRSVAVLSKIPGLVDCLSKKLPGVNFRTVNPEQGHQELKNVEVLIADPDIFKNYIYSVPSSLKWVQATWAGVEQILNLIDSSKPPLAQIINVERDLAKSWDSQRRREWDRSGKIENFRVIADLTFGVLGIGQIGGYIAKALHLFGAKVWGLTRSDCVNKVDYITEYRTMEQVGELLEVCDYVVSVLPDSQNTRGLLSRERLEKAKSGQVLVNIGRGSVVALEDLEAALKSGRLSAAVLDVFPEEPLPPDSPLWTMPQVRITPHVSGISRSKDIADVFVHNYELWLSGQPFPNLVNIAKGY